MRLVSLENTAIKFFLWSSAHKGLTLSNVSREAKRRRSAKLEKHQSIVSIRWSEKNRRRRCRLNGFRHQKRNSSRVLAATIPRDEWKFVFFNLFIGFMLMSHEKGFECR